MRSVKFSIIKGIRAVKYSEWINRKFPGIKHKDLWRPNRNAFAKAGFVGAFCAFIPVPLQMPLAAIIAYFAKANIPFSVALAWITNPVTMWPIWTFGYLVGAWILGMPTLRNIEVTEGLGVWGWLIEVFPQIWLPLWFGNIFMGLLVGSILYLVIRFIPIPHFNRDDNSKLQAPKQADSSK
ncbi:DUF2062 domain-containing protein [Thiomicrospira cyclica]|uniref:DUF2062 domain-containing protein n=1 Tax=Thiomicrospira cyclica (strain DSM 14477 / JCM 11371 / ALM1) TaxID=717773 RepID=F6DCE2_THICA|nr:DUF2062 domain-containing protein [Thiomicrospira cyclica]AEG31528.1 Protein of unknown function DUF2062 [Thiomicrospira cyclica ALM1]